MKLRPLKIGDYDSMIALWKSSGLPYKPRGRDSKKEIEGQLERDPDLFIGAFEGDELIGVVIGSDDGRKGWINRLAVEPRFMGQGIARALIAKVEASLKKRGRRIICTLIEDYNDVSLSLFKAQGYVLHKDINYLSKRENEGI